MKSWRGWVAYWGLCLRFHPKSKNPKKKYFFFNSQKCEFIVFKFFKKFMNYVWCWYFEQWFIGVATKEIKEINFFEKKPILLVCKNVWLYIYKEKTKRLCRIFRSKTTSLLLLRYYSEQRVRHSNVPVKSELVRASFKPRITSQRFFSNTIIL